MKHAASFGLLSALIACLTTAFDLDRVFASKGRGHDRARRSAWWWGFVLLNGVLACIVYFAVRTIDPFRAWNSWLLSVSAGIGYLAIVRLKFATVQFKGNEVPVGIDTFYEAGRQVVFNRINELVKQDRRRAVEELLDANTLLELGRAARLDINLDSLLTTEERRTRLAWLLSVLTDPTFDDDQRRVTIATYLAVGAQI